MTKKRSKPTKSDDKSNTSNPSADNVGPHARTCRRKKESKNEMVFTLFHRIIPFFVIIGAAAIYYCSGVSSLFDSRSQTDPNTEQKTTIDKVDTVQNQQSRSIVVGGYLPDYRSHINVNATSAHLTDLILFSIAPPDYDRVASLAGSCCLGPSHYDLARKAREYKERQLTVSGGQGYGERLRVLVSVGGGGRSNSFAKRTVNESRRRQFISDLKELCLRESLDGIDFDWESPQNQQEFISYMQLILEATTTFHDSGLIVTVALHVKQFLPKQVYDAIDQIHFMTYDMLTPSGIPMSYHHSQYQLVIEAVNELLSRGCPPSKIVLGIPAYARHSQNPGLVKTYAEIIDGLTEHEGGSTPSYETLSSLNSFDGCRFDSLSDIRKKVLFAKEQDLAGVFFWEIGQDKQHEQLATGGVLLESASHAAAVSEEDTANTELKGEL